MGMNNGGCLENGVFGKLIDFMRNVFFMFYLLVPSLPILLSSWMETVDMLKS